MDTKSLPSGNFPVDTKSSDPFKIIIKEEDDDVSLPGSRLHQTNNEGFIELRQRLEKMRTDPFSSFVRVDGGTLSGCWEATGVDMVYSINVKTVNRWWETYTSILDPMDNHQQQQYELPTNVGPENRNEYGYNSSCGEASTRRHYPYMPLVHIDFLSGEDQIDVEKGHNSHTDLASYRAWNDYRNQLKNSKFDDDVMKMMSGIFIAVAGQVVSGMMVNRLTSSASSSSSSWAGPIVELATVLGLCVTLAGISLRAKSRPLSTLMIKIGAVTTAWAIIFSMGLHLPPVMAWTIGPVAFLIMALAAAFA